MDVQNIGCELNFVSILILFHSKGKVRTIEGTAIVQDLREPAKLGVSFSYCEYITHFSPFLTGLSNVIRIITFAVLS